MPQQPPERQRSTSRMPLGPRDENAPPVSRFGYKRPGQALRPPTDEQAHSPSPCKPCGDRLDDAVCERENRPPQLMAARAEPEAALPDLLALFKEAMPDPDDLVPLLRLKPTAGPYDFKDRINELTGMIKPLKAAITEQRRGCLDLETALGRAQEELADRVNALSKDRSSLRAANESLESALAAIRQKAEERGQRIKHLETAAAAAKQDHAKECSRFQKELEAQQLEHAKERRRLSEELGQSEEAAGQRQAAERSQLEASLAELRRQLEEERTQHSRALLAARRAAEEASQEMREEHARAAAAAERSHAEATAAMEASHAEALSQQSAEAERRLAAAHAGAAKERASVFEATEQQRAEAQAAMEAAKTDSAQMAHRLEEVRAQAAREQAAALAALQRQHGEAAAAAEARAAEALEEAEAEAARRLEELRQRAKEEQASALAAVEQRCKEAVEAAEAAKAQALKAQTEEAARRLGAAKAQAEKEKADALAAADRLREEAVAVASARAEAAKAEALAAHIAEEMRRRTQAAQGQVEALEAQERSHDEALSSLKASKTEALAAQAAEHARMMEEVHSQAVQEREEALASARRRHEKALAAALAKQAAEAEVRLEEVRAEVLAGAAAERAKAVAARSAEVERALEEARGRAEAEKAEALASAQRRHGEDLAAQQAEAERRLLEAREQAAQQQVDALAAAEQAHMEALAVQASEATRRLEGACAGTVQAQAEALAATERSRAEALATQVQHLERQCRRLEADRRGLHNTVQELRGNVRVFARVRPSADVSAAGAVSCLPDEASLQLTLPCRSSASTDEVSQKEHVFNFNRVFGPSSRQLDCFDEVSPLVQSALDGYKVCLFSYGQTGSGKTHTMLGECTEDGRGIIPRSVEQVVQASKSHRTRGWEYTMEASCVEIYNDSVRDLLSTGSQSAERQVILPASTEGCPRVSGTETEKVTSVEVARELVQRVAAARVTKRTHMNDESSRSHVLFMLYVTGAHKDNQQRLEGFLCFADLAGSERVKRSGVVGAELKEACKINQSLTALGDVFGAIGKGWDFVPYRNSKLTQLLQPCLSGDGKALMFVHLSPNGDDADESHLSLQFASRVNACCLSQRGGGPKRHITSAAPPSAASSGSGGAQARQGAVSRPRRQSPR